MSEKTTLKADRSRKKSKPANPAGLLQFYPLGQPPTMRFFALGRGETDIGRSESCGIYIEDEQMSRKHALVGRSGEGWQVADCDSTNGVLVNDRRTSSCLLYGGEMIRIGNTFFRFFKEGTAASDQAHPVRTGGMVGGPALDELRELLDRAAQGNLTVLLIGETGTGKEVAAERLHRRGARHEGPFVPVNCGAIPADLVESELFGHVKGAFSGATVDQMGLIREAEGGTLFLDEIGELSLKSQVKLLRVLQDHRVRPVGGTRAIRVDIRVVCATNQDLGVLVTEGKFRQDLYARIAEFVIQLPSLRQRAEDIPLLVQHFIEKHDAGRRSVPVDVMGELCYRRWSSNIRQLENAVRRALLVAHDAPELQVEHFPAREEDAEAGERTTGPSPAARSFADDPMAIQLDEALRQHAGDVERAAEQLGISRSQLYRRAKGFGIDVPSYRE